MKAALLLFLLLALESSAFAESRGRYTSPDQQLYAIVRLGNTPESRYVEIYAADKQVITDWGFGGPPGRPRRILDARWSPDSKLFLFTVTNSPPRPRFTKYAFVRSESTIREFD